MQLLSRLYTMKEDALQWLDEVIKTRGAVRGFLGKVLLAMLFVVMTWDYVIRVVWALRDAFEWFSDRIERMRAFEEVSERQERLMGSNTTADTPDSSNKATAVKQNSIAGLINKQNLPHSQDKHGDDDDDGGELPEKRSNNSQISPEKRRLAKSDSWSGDMDIYPDREYMSFGKEKSTNNSEIEELLLDSKPSVSKIEEKSPSTPCSSQLFLLRRPPPEVMPLTTLEELLCYERPAWGQGFARTGATPFVAAPWEPLQNRLLVCHDFAGGYGEDRRVQGGGYERAYRVYDWGIIDIFVYFSHNLVTIPPLAWTDIAHRHGTRVLGTFITEWGKGYDVCADLLRSRETADRAADRLVKIAEDYGFDGWLINIENKVDPGANIEMMKHFLKTLTEKMRASFSTSRYPLTTTPEYMTRKNSTTVVLWYDSVTVDGNLQWQDTLNSKNRAFFDVCDGIFTNYCWQTDYPSNCALQAKTRRLEVYMGIDVHGRGTWGCGGFDCNKALDKIRRAGVSAALFAPGWTMENKIDGGGIVGARRASEGRTWGSVECEFDHVDGEFWAKIAQAWHAPRAIPGPAGGRRWGAQGLPLCVNFGRGVGDRWRICGDVVAVFRHPVAADVGDDGENEVVDSGRESGGGGGGGEVERLGGAFYDIMAQCLTPCVGARRGRSLGSDVAQARRLGDPGGSMSGANGIVGASYSFAESFDGSSCLCLTGALNKNTIASFPLYMCDIPLPAEPLEIRVTFSGNADSEIALVLMLDTPDQMAERKEVVLRNWGQEGKPSSFSSLSSTKTPVFSKRLQTAQSHRLSFAPVEESCTFGPSVIKNNLQARVSCNSQATPLQSDTTERSHLRGGGRGDSSDLEARASHDNKKTPPPEQTSVGTPSAATTAARSVPRWITRKYVVHNLRMGGSRVIKEIQVVCSRRNNGDDMPVPAEETSQEGLRLLPGRRRNADGEDRCTQRQGAGVEVAEGKRVATGGGRQYVPRGIAGLAAYRCCLGEVVIGPWCREASSMFRRVKSLRVVEVVFVGAVRKGTDGGKVRGRLAAAPDDGGAAVVDFSLKWELDDIDDDLSRGTVWSSSWVDGQGSSRVLHWDLWEATEELALSMAIGEGGWRWLGRAYGSKYRVSGLKMGCGWQGRKTVLAVQQVNPMGYRQPVGKWAKLELSLPSDASIGAPPSLEVKPVSFSC